MDSVTRGVSQVLHRRNEREPETVRLNEISRPDSEHREASLSVDSWLGAIVVAASRSLHSAFFHSINPDDDHISVVVIVRGRRRDRSPVRSGKFSRTTGAPKTNWYSGTPC